MEYKPEEKSCEHCSNDMVLRKGPKGQFYGCSSFPKCRYVTAVK
jgi:restriction system protein